MDRTAKGAFMIRQAPEKSSTSSRRGISLIEVMIVITGVAMMLGLCAISLQLLMQLNSDAQARLSAARALERLSGQLRDDVHACAAVELAPDPKAPTGPTGLRLRLEPDHVVTYGVRQGSLIRDESRGGKTFRHESYSLPRGRTARFERRIEGGHPLVALVMTQDSGKRRTDLRLPLEIVAFPGKDRFIQRGAGS
jgi:hypothetical protein